MSAPSRGAPIKTRATIVSPEGAVNSQEGYRKFLQTYAVHYDERYAWD
jgi:hypothetical protein